MFHSKDHSDCIPVTPRVSKHSLLYLGRPRSLKKGLFFGERLEAPLPPLRPQPKYNFIHPRQLNPFPEILSGYENLTPQEQTYFTTWVKVSEHEFLVQHMVNIQKATAEFREASERKPATSSHKNSFSKQFATRSIVQRRLSMHNWNPGAVAERKMPSRHEFQEGGISLPCKRRLTTLTTSFSRIAST